MPCSSFSRTCPRRSTASGAFETAIVWFWHTRQRSSCETSITRLSSSLVGGASPANAPQPSAAKTARRKTLRIALELCQERQDLALEHLRGHRTDLLVADYAALIDHVGFGHAVDAVVDPHGAFHVVGRRLVRIAVALEPAQGIRTRVLVVQSVERHPARF